MLVNKINILFLFLITGTCAAGLIHESRALPSVLELDKATINVIKSCYGNQGNAVGVGGMDISGHLVEAFSSELIPIVLVTNSTRTRVERRFRQRKVRFSLQVFVFDIASFVEFKTIIKEMFETIWWNNFAPFLLINRSDHCYGAETLLIQAWKHEMINAKVICSDYHDKVMIITYNPFMDHAPETWQFHVRLPIYPSPWDNHFVLYTRYYYEGKEVCDNLDFDKLKNLDGYPICVLQKMSNSMQIYTTERNKKQLRNSQRTKLRSDNLRKNKVMHEHIINTFIWHVNGTKVDIIHDIKSPHDKTPFGDILFGTTPLMRGFHEPISRPFVETGVQVMTQHNGYMTQLEKIFSVVDVFSNIAVCMVLAVTAIFFKFFARHTFGSAFLNIIRIVCNTGLENLPVNTPSRLYLTTLLLFAVTMQGIYQGNLAALLTNEIPIRNVVTWKDLVDLGHTVYMASGTIQMFQEPEFEGRVIKMEDYADCSEYVLRNSSVACMDHPIVLSSQAEEWNLHLSKVFEPSLGAYMIRPDWFMERQLNFVLGKLFEGDIIVPLLLREYRKELGYTNVDDVKDEETEQVFRNMTFRDLKFAFVMLSIGLLCASVTFVFEIVLHRRQAQIDMKKVAVRPFVISHCA